VARAKPAAPASIKETLLDRMWNQPTAKDWADVLAMTPLFERLSRRRLRRIAELATFKEFEQGAILIRIDEPGDALYVILSGRAKVVGRPRARTLGIGDHFGEMALIDGEPRSATVTAATHLQAMRLPRKPFLRLIRDEPAIALALMTELAARVRRLEKPPAA
jgi:CRP/FNR family cyclic AMP-dependent transcriptional regulator